MIAMEPIPEQPAQMHFYRLLELLARHNTVLSTQVQVKPPNSLLVGFGFNTPMQMCYSAHRLQFHAGLTSQFPLSSLNLYPQDLQGDFPQYILKSKGKKTYARSSQDAVRLLTLLTQETRTR